MPKFEPESFRIKCVGATRSNCTVGAFLRNYTNGCKKRFFFDGATARGGPWPPLQYASKPLDPLLCLSIRLFPSFSAPWTRHPTISFLVVRFVLLHTAFRTSFLGLISCFQPNAHVYYIFSYSSTCFEPYCAHHQEDLLFIHSIWFFMCHSSCVTVRCTVVL